MPILLRPPLQQHGLITARAARDAGISSEYVRRLVRAGDWVTVRRATYAESELWESLDEYVGRPRLMARAGHLSVRAPHAMSHDSAALELGLPLIGVPDRVHVTRPGINGSRNRFGVTHHGGRFTDAQTLLCDGIPVLDGARTALDIAREHGYQAGVVACDAAHRQGVTPAVFAATLEAMRYWPGTAAARMAFTDSDPRAESAGESLSRILLSELGLGPIWPQFPLRLPDGHVVWIDLVIGCHAFEFDGRIKYQQPDRGGVASADADTVIWNEKRRERLIRECGFGGISRIVWSDFWGRGRGQARQRLTSEYAVTRQRCGERLPDGVLEFARRNVDSWRQRL